MNQFDRELQNLEDDLESGNISSKEFGKEMRELERDYRDAARESAQRAHDDEMGRW